MLVYRRQRRNEGQGYAYAGQQAQTEGPSGTVQEDEVTSKSPGGTMP